MSRPALSLVPARLEFDAHGAPFNAVFGDVYRPVGHPLHQAEQVFLAGNGLPHRWAGQPVFTVAETGFGLGHNFLAAWQAWRSDSRRCGRLHFVSFEAHPFHRDDIRRYAAGCLEGEAQTLAAQLADAWPVLVPGIHRLEFEGGHVTLTLAFGPVQALVNQVDAVVDAFFLDGFSPGLNPDMWSPRVFGQLVRMAADSATLATWCCAEPVRSNLEAAGFQLRREPDAAVKCLITRGGVRPGVGRARAQYHRPASVVVVGAGIAGASVAWAMARQGVQVTVFDPVLAGGTGASHMGHAALAVSPMFQRQDNERARLSRAGVLRAAACWQGPGFDGAVARVGTFMPAYDALRAGDDAVAVKNMQLHHEWQRWISAAEATKLTGVHNVAGGAWFPLGMRVLPQMLVETLLSHPGIRCVPDRADTPRRTDAGLWRVDGVQGAESLSADAVMLCNAAGMGAMLQAGGWGAGFDRLANMGSVAGEVYRVPALALSGLHAVVSGNGYCVPADDGNLVVGSTYRRGVGGPEPGVSGRGQVLDKVCNLLSPMPAATEAIANWRQAESVQAWGGWRASVRDRLPVVGPVGSDGSLWLAGAFASRGFGLATLAADVIVARLFAEPVPLERELLARLLPR